VAFVPRVFSLDNCLIGFRRSCLNAVGDWESWKFLGGDNWMFLADRCGLFDAVAAAMEFHLKLTFCGK